MAEIRDLVEADWPRVREIHAEGIAARDATFGTEPPTWARVRAGAAGGALVARVGAAGLWTIQTSVFPGNAASPALHELWASGSPDVVSGSHSSAVPGAIPSCSSFASRTRSVSAPATPKRAPSGILASGMRASGFRSAQPNLLHRARLQHSARHSSCDREAGAFRDPRERNAR